MAINLENYAIYESTGNKYTFPAAEIGPKSYLVIYCCADIADADEVAASAQAAASSEAAASAGTAAAEAASATAVKETGQLCTGFRLSKDGTTLVLSSPLGTLQKLTVPALETDISYGYRDGGSYGYFLKSTPGQPNTTASYDTMEELRTNEQVSLVISEVLPKDVSDAEPYAWAELYNAGATTIQLSDYYITENLSNLKKAQLPPAELPPGAYAVIRFADQAGDDAVPFRIGSDETTLAISDNLGVVIDRITWDADILPGLSAGHGEGDSVVYYTLPTPGAANSAASLSTVDISLTEGRGEVYMNELLVSNTFSVIDQYGERSPWVEL